MIPNTDLTKNSLSLNASITPHKLFTVNVTGNYMKAESGNMPATVTMHKTLCNSSSGLVVRLTLLILKPTKTLMAQNAIGTTITIITHIYATREFKHTGTRPLLWQCKSLV
jgi:hypothetical protein